MPLNSGPANWAMNLVQTEAPTRQPEFASSRYIDDLLPPLAVKLATEAKSNFPQFIGTIMKKFLSILASAAVLAMPLAVISTPASAQTGAPVVAPAATPTAKAPVKAKAKAKAKHKSKAKAKMAKSPA